MNRQDPRQGIALNEAIARIIAQVKPLERCVTCALAQAHNKFLASDIIAQSDVPAFPASAMDGYGVSLIDYDPKVGLQVVGEAFAGRPFDRSIGAGEAVRVFTGSVLVAGVDAVVIQEDVRRVGDQIFFEPVPNGQFVRPAGINVRQGERVLTAGTRIDARVQSQLASVGASLVEVYDALRVGILNTGDELVDIGEALGEGQIYNSNRWYLSARVTEVGAHISEVIHAKDTAAATQAAIEHLVDVSDLVVISGGASVGDADFVRGTLAELGTVHFDKVASRPGKPVSFVTIGAVPVFGLPGNPASVAISFEQLVKPTIGLLNGRQWQSPLRCRAQSTQAFEKSRGRTEFQRAVVVREDDALVVTPVRSQDSSIGQSLIDANAFIVLDADVSRVEAGEWVDVELFGGHYVE